MFNKSKTIKEMKKKQGYRTPGVLEKIPVCPESPILAGSIVERTAVKTTGQDNGGFYDNNNTSFNFKWEE